MFLVITEDLALTRRRQRLPRRNPLCWSRLDFLQVLDPVARHSDFFARGLNPPDQVIAFARERAHLSDKSSVLACKVPVANNNRLDRFEAAFRWHRRSCLPRSSTPSQTSVEVRARGVGAAYLSFAGSLRTRGSTDWTLQFVSTDQAVFDEIQ